MSSLSPWRTPKPFSGLLSVTSSPSLLPFGIALTWVQHFALGLVEHHGILMSPLLKFVRILRLHCWLTIWKVSVTPPPTTALSPGLKSVSCRLCSSPTSGWFLLFRDILRSPSSCRECSDSWWLLSVWRHDHLFMLQWVHAGGAPAEYLLGKWNMDNTTYLQT